MARNMALFFTLILLFFRVEAGLYNVFQASIPTLDHTSTALNNQQPIELTDLPSDLLIHTLQYLPLDQILENRRHFHSFIWRKAASLSIQRPEFHSRQLVRANIRYFIQLANDSILGTQAQQLWMLESVLGYREYNVQLLSRWMHVIKTKCRLDSFMYSICIRMIQDSHYAHRYLLAADFIQYLYSRHIQPIPNMGFSSSHSMHQMSEVYQSRNATASSLLIQAVERGDTLLVKQVLDENPLLDCNIANTRYETPLSLASRDNHVDIARLVLSQCISLNVNKVIYYYYKAPLLYACEKGHVELVVLLLQRPDIDINTSVAEGKTALMYACDKGHIQIVSLLLKRVELDVNRVDDEGKSALIYACEKGHTSIVNLLLDVPHVSINQDDNDYKTALMHAIQQGHVDVVKALLTMPSLHIQHEDFYGTTAFMMAAQSCNLDIIRLLVEHPDIEMNRRDRRGWTALEYARDPECRKKLDKIMKFRIG